MKKNILLLFISCLANFMFAQNSLYVPADAGVINIKMPPYNAMGDGITDDTKAIQQAISDNVINDYLGLGSYWNRHRIIYLPKGTYLVSSRIEWRHDTIWGAYLSFMGESRDSCIIRLKDNCPGYQDTANVQAVIFNASDSEPNPYDDWTGKGEGAEAYDADIRNITVNTGNGNPGAVGIDYIGNNVASIRNINILTQDGQGKIGLAMMRCCDGPNLVSNVKISGFDYGIYVNKAYDPTIEHVSLNGQNVAGVFNSLGSITIRDLTSTNSVPAVISFTLSDHPHYSMLTLLDANLIGGSSIKPAIQIQGVSNYLLRNINTSGYQSALDDNGNWISGSTIVERASDTVKHLFPSPNRTLGLTIKETPIYDDTIPSDWANVQSYGAVADTTATKDASPGFQAAIDAGKSVVYIPFGSYFFGSTIHVRGNVRKIIGFGGELHPLHDTCFKDGVPLFQIENNNVDTIFIERMIIAKNAFTGANSFGFGNPLINHVSPKVLVLKDFGSTKGLYSNQSGSGAVFLENVCGGTMEFNNTEVWCRQLNPEDPTENPNFIHVINNGSKLWILGLKTESEGTILKTINNGFTELFGGWHFLWSNSATPAFINIESNQSLNYTTGNSADYVNQVAEVRGGVSDTLTSANALHLYLGTAMPLFTGYDTTQVTGVRTLSNPNFFELNVLPNPAMDKIYFETWSSAVTPVAVSVFSIEGKLLINKNMNLQTEKMMDVSSLAAGIYFVRFTNDKINQNQKIIIIR